MTDNELKRLRSYYYSLLDQQRMLDGLSAGTQKRVYLYLAEFRVLEGEIRRIEEDFPDLLPPFMGQDFQIGRDAHGQIVYALSGVQAYLAGALGRLKVALETSESTPVTEAREFAFVSDAGLRKIIERDYSEIQRAYIAGCWKSVIILSGGAIETILLDLLQHNSGAAMGASKAPKGKTDLTRWDLSDLVNVSVELGLVTPGVEKLSHSVREYRNLIHPGSEVRNKLAFSTEEARIALEVLHIVHRDLS
jgi:hypothetical protein